MPRLFLAVDIPAAYKQTLSAMQSRLPGARWSSPQQMHLTLHFLGDMPLEPVQRALESVQATGFSLSLSGVGTFPNRGKARVLWAGVDESEPLLVLHQKLGEALQTVGYQPDKRPYHPHITLARFRQPPPQEALQAYLATHQAFKTATFSVKDCILYESQLGSDGAVYINHKKIVLP
jgi:2'-5' RNA ligase